jgi:hypothetical protein
MNGSQHAEMLLRVMWLGMGSSDYVLLLRKLVMASSDSMDGIPWSVIPVSCQQQLKSHSVSPVGKSRHKVVIFTKILVPFGSSFEAAQS